MQRLLLLGLNHATAPLEVREKLAFTSEQQKLAVESLRRKFPDCEIVLLSTCNRVELYFARETHGQPRADQMIEFLSEFHQIPTTQFKSLLYERAQKEAVEHLFGVSSSLNSMVIGESQILGQVRQAYDISRELGATGGVLNPLFQRAIAVGKEVMHGTSLGDGRVSISGVAVGYARRIFDSFDDKTVLCVGAGKMGALALRGFSALQPGRLVVCNRDVTKAQQLAAEIRGEASGLDTLEEQLVRADIVITSTGSTHPIITLSQFQRLLKQRRYRPIFIIDIAVPRDVEADVGKLDHVYLYNLDDLQRAVTETHSQRADAVEAAKGIVARHVEEFVVWNRQREMGPMIDQLYKRLHELAAQEVSRTISRMPGAGEQERAQLEDLARRIVNKLLHDPVTALRKADQLHGTESQYLHALQQLFLLSQETHDDPGTTRRGEPG